MLKIILDKSILKDKDEKFAEIVNALYSNLPHTYSCALDVSFNTDDELGKKISEIIKFQILEGRYGNREEFITNFIQTILSVDSEITYYLNYEFFLERGFNNMEDILRTEFAVSGTGGIAWVDFDRDEIYLYDSESELQDMFVKKLNTYNREVVLYECDLHDFFPIYESIINEYEKRQKA